MFEIIAMILLGRHIGRLAQKKGEDKTRWIIRMVLLWIGFEFLAMLFMVPLMGIKPPNVPNEKLLELMLIGLCAGFGGYLITRRQLEKKPDAGSDIDNIGNNFP